MEIKIGKTYSISPTYKKSVVENEHWEGENGSLIVSILWRSGTFWITPQNEDEVRLIEEAMTEEDIEFCVSDFEEWELRETFDGCSEDLHYEGDWDEDKFEAFEQEYFEDRWETMEKYGFSNDECEYYIHCKIDVDEVEGEE